MITETQSPGASARKSAAAALRHNDVRGFPSGRATQKKRVMKPVKMYTTPICPYCVRAKSLLAKKGAEVEEIDVFMDPDAREEMQAKTGGARTVPQIFIGDTYVGGCDELHALEREGRLDPLLK